MGHEAWPFTRLAKLKSLGAKTPDHTLDITRQIRRGRAWLDYEALPRSSRRAWDVFA